MEKGEATVCLLVLSRQVRLDLRSVRLKRMRNRSDNNKNRTRRRRRIGLLPPSSTTTLVVLLQLLLLLLLLLSLIVVVLVAAATAAGRTSSVIGEERRILNDPTAAAAAPEAQLLIDHEDHDNSSFSFISSHQRQEEEEEEDGQRNAILRNATTLTPSSSYGRQLLSLTDPQVQERYLADPPGHRKHPSYYSDTYLRRAAPRRESMTATSEQWGSWTLVDHQRSIRPGDDFYTQYPNRDVPLTDFPADTAWQRNSGYVEQFLHQATNLTMRAMESILAEYGHGPSTPGTADFAQRSAALQVEQIAAGEDLAVTAKSKDAKTNGGWMPQQSWNGLKRRLLHAVMTQDSFHLVMGGHSAAAGT
jgi:hypothetical protein